MQVAWISLVPVFGVEFQSDRRLSGSGYTPVAFVIADLASVKMVWTVVCCEAVSLAVDGEGTIGDAIGYATSHTAEVWTGTIAVGCCIVKSKAHLPEVAACIWLEHRGDGGSKRNNLHAQG